MRNRDRDFFCLFRSHSFCTLVNTFFKSMRLPVRNPFIAFIPFLIAYFVIILVVQNDAPFGDESRYLQFASNLIQGFYSPPPPSINLWNGPGFPMYLTLFLAAGVPLITVKLFNALLYYLVLILFYKTALTFTAEKIARRSSLVFALYYLPYKSLPHVLSEIFTIFLIASILYCSSVYFSIQHKKSSIPSAIVLALLLAYLALTKVIFGSVFLILAVILLVLFAFTKNVFFKKSLTVLVLALGFCLPYLVYTYHLTGKYFYWSNAGGMSLYWMSNPAKGEYGEWYNDSLTSARLNAQQIKMLQDNHKSDYALVKSLTGVQKDEKFRELAFENIRAHPEKFFLNWIANWSRMLSNYPAGYKSVDKGTIANLLANIPLLFLLMYSAIKTLKRQIKLPPFIKFMVLMAFFYLMVSSLFSAYDRMFYILAPVFGIWICYTFTRQHPERANTSGF